MLFNSYTFLLGFLPLALAVFHGLRRLRRQRPATLALVVLSLVFYGWWNAAYLLLLVPLMLASFALAVAIAPRDGRQRRHAKPLLVLGIALNLGALGWFKYANFFIDNMNSALGLNMELARIVLPLGISFFVFQKIAFLVDASRGRVDRFDLLDYSLFVTFFPQLIAGPIVHHSEVLPQFHQRRAVTAESVPLGLTILLIGLAKKVLLADNIAAFASARFDAAAAGSTLATADAWAAALSYTAQLYFDFSGYSDMAIGAALLFGIRLPVNFASPYKAHSVADFWRRWHITLSRFLRDYLYVPLGGNRRGALRRYLNLFITMSLGGLWHGAGWTFLAWGALHGGYLAVNHAWRAARVRIGFDVGRLPGAATLSWLLTFVAVIAAWVLFRAADIGTAARILASMSGGASEHTASFSDTWTALAAALAFLALARFAPNTQEITGYVGPGEMPDMPRGAARIRWRASPAWAVATGAVAAIALMSLSHVSEFLYFQF